LGRRQGCAPLLVLIAIVALAASACGLYDDHPFQVTPTPSHANLLQNPGFESGMAPWSTEGHGAVTISSMGAHGGEHSIELKPGSALNAIAMQTLSGNTIPEFVSGFYRTDAWPVAADHGELEFAVRVTGGAFPDGRADHTVVFLIGGRQSDVPQDPFDLNKYVFLSRAAPTVGAWTYFAYPVADAFKQQFGATPSSVDSVTLSLELGAFEQPLAARFDDIYAGPQLANPNRPPQE
jgi:hypothetical protein